MDAHPPTTESDPGAVESDPGAVESDPGAVDADSRATGAAPPLPRPESARDLIPWITEIAFVTGVLVIGLVVLLVLTSGENPFATALIPIIVVLAVIAAVMRHRSVRSHQGDAKFQHARHVARERRGF